MWYRWLHRCARLGPSHWIGNSQFPEIACDVVAASVDCEEMTTRFKYKYLSTNRSRVYEGYEGTYEGPRWTKNINIEFRETCNKKQIPRFPNFTKPKT
jgi:hypothetical protein